VTSASVQLPSRAVPFGQAWRAWARVAAQSFGGPAGQIAVIHRIAVEEKRWLDERTFLRALGYCMLLPGPEAQQLATYIGWKLHGVRGGLVAGGLFVLPGFLAILALSVVYVVFGSTPMLGAVFYGLKPAVLAIVLQAVARLRKRALGDPLSITLAAGALVAMFAFGVPFPLVVLTAAMIGAWAGQASRGRGAEAELHTPEAAPDKRAPVWHALRAAAAWLAIWLLPVAGLLVFLTPHHVFSREAVFFSKTAVVTFGGAYAVLAYVAQQAVEVYHWLAPAEMLDGLGLAETTPGPLIQVVQFVGFLGAYRNPGGLDPLVAGIFGSVVTTWMTFAPCFLFIFAGAPFLEVLSQRSWLQAALAAITAAVVGVILNLAVWFSLHTLFAETRTAVAGPVHLNLPVWSTLDIGSALIATTAVVLAFRYRAGIFTLLGFGTGAGILLSSWP